MREVSRGHLVPEEGGNQRPTEAIGGPSEALSGTQAQSEAHAYRQRTEQASSDVIRHNQRPTRTGSA